MFGKIPFICAIKMAATASYRAVPSMFIVAPIGNTNLNVEKYYFKTYNLGEIFFTVSLHLLIRGSTPFFSSRVLIVTGRVAELDAVPNAVTYTFPILAKNLDIKINIDNVNIFY